METAKENIFRKITRQIALLYVFIMPIAEQVALIGAVMGVFWLISAFVTKFRYVKVNGAVVLFSLFYLLHLISLGYTENIEAGLFDIQLKFSLFVFPFALMADDLLNEKRLLLIKIFVLGCLLSGLLSFIKAGYLLFTGHGNHFFYMDFPLVLHPSYLSMYMSFSVLVLLYGFLDEEYILLSGKKVLNVVSVLLICFFQLLLSSKLGWITTGVIILIFSIVYIVKFKKWLIGFTVIVSMAAVTFLSYTFISPVRTRVDNLFAAVSGNSTANSSESSAVRIAVWKVGSDLAKENWVMGLGPGDVKDELLKKYKEEGISGAYKVNEREKIERVLNAHNEFLQVFLAVGILGFILLLVYFIWPLMNCVSQKNWIYFGFLLICLANFMVESMLETQAGVLFYGFFNALLFGNRKDLISQPHSP